jgi:HPt (histidine-containing phosphotransfer) domain-containing protein
MEVSTMRGVVIREMFECVPEIDFNSGYHYFLGNMDNYSNALMSILKSIKSKLPLLQTMNFTEEYEGLRTIAQTLRKMLGNIGAAGIAETTYQLETALLNEDTEYIQEQLAYYIISLIELSDHLEILLKKMDVKGMVKDDDNSSFLNYDFTKTKESIKLSSDLLERKII